ncbi:MAG: hypothetical protein COX62_01460 [Deltaproteobacteria bacterium CG_4_10_14_0_2_um_filter_43_8]|nr:MAG: hypothetical protein COV43_01450 [Deltaproteobacteria bacterium CG11_big_fil_rev_8_21_14_0_20_42_23]PJA21785.1 MAG: hypothetical protein COX62_01460 [Deltaproteobacteria bacterium CG_4_10_14_0_2_um_filter_43_8]PJC64239.1 MAG: hypothetical protein CO021_05275 [Deltaproteobacteria bacterium CG_4_9_14_0_2_um_filter_42_21]
MQVANSPFVSLPRLHFDAPAKGALFPNALGAQISCVGFLQTQKPFVHLSSSNSAASTFLLSVSPPSSALSARDRLQLQCAFASYISKGFPLISPSKKDSNSERVEQLAGALFPTYVYFSLLHYLKVGTGESYFETHINAALDVYETASGDQRPKIGAQFLQWMKAEELTADRILEAVHLGLITSEAGERMLSAASRALLDEIDALVYFPCSARGRRASRFLVYSALLALLHSSSPLWSQFLALSSAMLAESCFAVLDRRANDRIDRREKWPRQHDLTPFQSALAEEKVAKAAVQGRYERNLQFSALVKKLFSPLEMYLDIAYSPEQFLALEEDLRNAESQLGTVRYASPKATPVVVNPSPSLLPITEVQVSPPPPSSSDRTPVADEEDGAPFVDFPTEPMPAGPGVPEDELY